MKYYAFCAMITAAALGMVIAPASAEDEYRLDDGGKEAGIGIQATGSNSIAWLNTFTAEVGSETINDVRIAFGAGLAGSNIPNGTLVDIYIWADPNQDGNPSDAFVLESITGLVQGSGTNAFTTFSLLNSQTFSVGESFFAGAIINYNGQLEVASIDEDGTDAFINYPPMNHSWIAGSGNGVAVNPNLMGGAQLGLESVSNALYGGASDATWMIRLNAVPAPGSIVMMGALTPMLLRRRR